MKQFVYKKINAFSTIKSGGNPAVCLYLDKEQQLSEVEMLSIAKEHKGFASEVIYCTPLCENSFRLKYYSSECEVEFCGHGTIACMYELIKNNETLIALPVITIFTNKGELIVYNELEQLNAVFITAPKPQHLIFSAKLDDITISLNISKDEINYNYPIELIDAGLRTLIVPVNSLENVIGMHPDEIELKEFCLTSGIDIILVFTTSVTDMNNIARTRVFAPKFGYLEDPATGSGNSAFGYYMIKQHLWRGNPISIEQNAELNDYNIVKLKTVAERVLFGGSAVVKIEGKYFL
ncbi:PhzF family phenazine biosynthesis protein [Parabacteroides sp. PF5-5]|uniref:PhzF family phenazine biosynthesis protein n=1 Tax=unclassified Parabacteroides TaxID=2649774 RepID=UPI002477236B|nr:MULTISPECIES: PhzF family phenazine biosynthesis isomerase [unclassified Parabacteroides]MDH6306751.1 PhzF family phenazine biosynthesis protein [Parabacteroides sp. PH5-39]MDH6317893.1 PhzF family phenazine biosynthesis protein [Parabacteroides sp. PF5-13]MDH6321396.1 PhzF family phenazine biosynthesis protein [Parabacteroides sp. PH5-13]MDH6325128.1 PhzF family phenazine biosynthesis protein [Parabacteroides sp. PH5-8]MDH6327434.1 PhzF family phenazine biosynthesis protein [Parabacteroide